MLTGLHAAGDVSEHVGRIATFVVRRDVQLYHPVVNELHNTVQARIQDLGRGLHQRVRGMKVPTGIQGKASVGGLWDKSP